MGGTESSDKQQLRDALMEVLDESALPGVEKRCVILRYGLIDNRGAQPGRGSGAHVHVH